MDRVISTPRLRITRLQSTELDSDDVKWTFAVRSDPQATRWNLHGVVKDLEEARKVLTESLPGDEGGATRYRATFAVHLAKPPSSSFSEMEAMRSRTEAQLLGLVFFKSEETVPIMQGLQPAQDSDASALILELGYMFLPDAWGNGYASEACIAVLESLRSSKSHFLPYTKLWVRAVVGHDNMASRRVLEKSGLPKMGVTKWESEPVFLAEKWQQPIADVHGAWIFT